MLVLGIGNTLLQDEGIGIHLLQYLAIQYPNLPNVRYLDGGTLSFTLAGEIEAHSHLLVLDAVELHAPPGTLCCYRNQAMDEFLGTAKRSAHEVGLLDLLSMARLADALPRERALIGIQYATFAWGLDLTPAVAVSIPRAAQQAVQLLQEWQAAMQFAPA
ncbi:MAG: hydrogenase maturation protease [Thiothrix sp.]|nr:MAG: hydrogenase maturation protease [Thiothrix sp.]